MTELSDFEIFWLAYPNKKSKGTARDKAWPRAIAKTNLQTMLDAIEVYRRCKPTWKAYMMPATWLNGECWEDEYEDATVDRDRRPYDTWSDIEKEQVAKFVNNCGTAMAVKTGYKQAHIDGLRADGLLRLEAV